MKLIDVKKFFTENKLPKEIRLNKATNIVDVEKFFNSHISILEFKDNSERVKIIYFERLLKVVDIIKEKRKKDDEFFNVNLSNSLVKLKPNLGFEKEI